MDWHIDTEDTRAHMIQVLSGMPIGFTVSVETEKTRTEAQRNSLELWCKQSAQVMSDAGVEQVMFMEMLSKRGIDMPWSQSSFKEIFRWLLGKVYGYTSTAQAKTTDYDVIAKGLQKLAAQENGVVLPDWPSHHAPIENN